MSRLFVSASPFLQLSSFCDGDECGVCSSRDQSCEAQLQAYDACGPTAGGRGGDVAGAARTAATYHASHNDYVLQLSAADAVHRHYHRVILPATLQVCCVRRHSILFIIYTSLFTIKW